jgi:hypothetical protein
MTHYGGKELAAAFRTVRNNTIKIAEEIPETKYDFRAAPDTRFIGQTLVHIALIPAFALHIHSNKIDNLSAVNFPELMQKTGAEEAKPRDKAEIVRFLKSEGERFASFLEGLSEAFLGETVTMPQGRTGGRSRFEMLLSATRCTTAASWRWQRRIARVPFLTRQMQERMALRA